MKKGVIAVLACVFALSLALVGCGSGGNSMKAAWIGTWDLNEMDDNGEVTNADDIAALREYGLDVYLELNRDGTSTFMLFGEEMTGTWDASSETKATLTMEGQTVDMSIADDRLSLTQDGSTLIFVKGEDRSDDSKSSSSASAEASSSSAASADDELVKIDQLVLADDDVAKITFDAMKVDEYGDPGYTCTITNNSKKKVYVYSANGWTVNGAEVGDPVLLEAIEPGDTVKGFMWFDHEETGIESTSDLVAVEGLIVVEDYESGDQLADYTFKM